MTISDISQKIERYRNALSTLEDSICFADLSVGASEKSDFTLNSMSLNLQHIQWLKICDGGRFGVIDLWSSTDLPTQQFYLEPALLQAYAKDDENLQAYFAQYALNDFYVFGQVLCEPMLINYHTGDAICPIDYDSSCLKMPFLQFVDKFVLGQGYAQFFVAENESIIDDWLNFIQNHH